MTDKDYVRLSNRQKIYLKDEYGKVSVKGLSNLAFNWGVFFDENVSTNLTSGEIDTIFNKVKEYALRDGKKKFSEEEMQAFIKDNCDEESVKLLGLNQQSLVQFLVELQEKSNSSLGNVAQNKKMEMYDEILEIFPMAEGYKNVEGSYFLETDDGYKLEVMDGQIVSFSGENFKYNFENGAIISSQLGEIGDEDFLRNLYVNGEIWRSLDSYGNTTYNYRMIDFAESLYQEDSVDKLKMLIEQSYQNGQIGQDMDDYFNMTGNELFNDISMSDIPDDVKEELLDKIYGIFDDTIRYNSELIVEHSQVQNDYYTGDEYSVRYNGPIVNIYNKTTNEETRLNLQKLLQLEKFNRRQRYKFLDEIQKLPAEVLENLAIEITYIEAMGKEDTYTVLGSDFRVGAFYGAEKINMYLPKGNFLIHELGHALDHIYPKDDIDSEIFASANGRFNAKYDELVARYEAKGNKRFDDLNPQKASRKHGDNYMTLNSLEGFAICFQAMMGCNDLQTKFLFNEMPELLDYAIENYHHIRSMKKEYRFKNLSEMRDDN